MPCNRKQAASRFYRMGDSMGNIEQRSLQYAISRGRILRNPLGSGYDGAVLSTEEGTAIKVFRYQKQYLQERDVYLRLHKFQFVEVCGCRIPSLIDFDDVANVVEMEIVQPPFVLDFAGAYLDTAPEFPEDVYQMWWDEKSEQFGEDWDLVQTIMAKFASKGIFLADVKPGNITLR